MRDSYSITKKALALNPGTLGSTTVGPVVDMAGYQRALLDLSIGPGGITFDSTNKVTYKLEHGDAFDASDMVAVTDADVLGVSGISGGVIKSLTAAHASSEITKFGYLGIKRYTRLTATFAGTHATGTSMAASWSLSDPGRSPVS